MRRASLHFVVRPRMARQVLPCVSALACGAETPFSSACERDRSMMLRTPVLFGALLGVLAAPAFAFAADRECAQSPGKVIEVCVFTKDGGAFYEVSRDGQRILAPAPLGLSFAGEPAARVTALTAARRAASDTTWDQPWGEQRTIRDNHAELTVSLAGDTARSKTFDVTFRLFDDGLPGSRWTLARHEAGELGEIAMIYDRAR